jgi:4-amino-4-deoxy-L-arabinose transferase-like glycosyltransferase
MSLGYVLAAVTGRLEKRDERDRLIGWRAESNASWLLAAGACGAIAALILGVQAVWVVHLLLASMFASETLKLSLQVLYYRRGC